MLSKNFIEQVIISQKERLGQLDIGLIRAFPVISSLSSHALIVTGIRRCGKSTLLQQINSSIKEKTLYLNFEDPRLAGSVVIADDSSKIWFICNCAGRKTRYIIFLRKMNAISLCLKTGSFLNCFRLVLNSQMRTSIVNWQA
jgi:predicted AAA+ superfamily ATPase